MRRAHPHHPGGRRAAARRGRLRLAALLTALAAAATACSGPDDARGAEPESGSEPGSDPEAGAAEPVTVFVAASLAEVAEQLSTDAGLDATVSAAGSSNLVSQVIAGAPADVLVTADRETMGRAVEAGVVKEPTVVARNHPALVVPAGNPGGVTGLDDSLADATLVVCAPQVPCGAATAELADLAGVTFDPASEELSVTDVLGTVTSGQADAGIVYGSDVLRGGAAVEEVPVPEAVEVTNAYPASVVAGTDDAVAARAWLDALSGEPGRRALTDAGFEVP
ncbi:molybdate ABC transporter substrate-binding protein [Georgenia halophila]|uniref:Molybdate ABC transporter substrate-binding protein n=1 Tax=Georgenia halophila TaxID=620889 RepID=A0ABP8LG14_9MICO